MQKTKQQPPLPRSQIKQSAPRNASCQLARVSLPFNLFKKVIFQQLYHFLYVHLPASGNGVSITIPIKDKAVTIKATDGTNDIFIGLLEPFTCGATKLLQSFVPIFIASLLVRITM